MRVCLIYDSLQPYRVGGAERWYHGLTEALGAAGHDVTYVTMRQWPRGEIGVHPTAKVVAVGPWLANYRANGRRTMAPPLLFGLGVLIHLIRHGRRYDVVHCSSFPYFALLAAAVARPFGGYRIVTDWLEFWSRRYWNDYLGPLGWVGWTVQRLCLAVRQHAFCIAELTGGRLRANDVNGPVEVLSGLYAGRPALTAPKPATPLVVFAARLIPEKRLPLALEAIALARHELPELQGVVFGQGPEWELGRDRIAALGLEDAVRMSEFVERPVLEETMSRALCLLHPSVREGYGLVVVEAAALGVPSILTAGEDNAATELVEDGVNGFVVPDSSPQAIADAIVRAHRAGDALRASTWGWFERNAGRLGIDASLAKVVASYSSESERSDASSPPRSSLGLGKAR
jgi:glycosyltransferase involved in cell wall biosynthesis